MTWKKSWSGRRAAEPNKLSKNPNICFRSNLNSEVLGHIKKLSSRQEKSKFINQAIEMKYFYDTKQSTFLKQIIKNNFKLCKHLLRQIGSQFAVTN